jgi:alanine dehydrogenase
VEVVADVPAEVAETGDARAADLAAADVVPFGAVLSGERERRSGPVVVASVGSATLDAAAGEAVYERAREAEVGTEVDLWQGGRDGAGDGDENQGGDGGGDGGGR